MHHRDKAKRCAVSVRSISSTFQIMVFISVTFILDFTPVFYTIVWRRALRRKLGESRRHCILKFGAKCDCILVQVGWVRVFKTFFHV